MGSEGGSLGYWQWALEREYEPLMSVFLFLFDFLAMSRVVLLRHMLLLHDKLPDHSRKRKGAKSVMRQSL